MLFFGVVYFAQGLAGGLIAQPLAYYFKSLGMAADQLAQSLAVIAMPWLLKPLYGLISDFIPLFGYRRKSYLLMMAGVAAIGYLWLTQLHAPRMIAGALFFATLGIAVSDVVVDAFMVENGQKTRLIKQFQGQQWTWLNLAAIVAGLLGGWLTQHLAAPSALHTAALIIACAPLVVAAATLLLVHEQKIRFERSHLRATGHDLIAAIKSKPLWTVAGFLAFWNMTPSFGAPLYYHMIDHLQFDQYFVGQLSSVGSVGATLGALMYRRYFSQYFSTQRLICLSIAISAVMTLAYLFLTNGRAAVLLYFAAGIVSMIPLLTLFSLAASVCPPQAAGFTFAALMSVYSVAAQVSAIAGAHLYERVFTHQIAPLICVAAGFTLAAFLWVPFLPCKTDEATVRKMAWKLNGLWNRQSNGETTEVPSGSL
jgi:MFS family permease